MVQILRHEFYMADNQCANGKIRFFMIDFVQDCTVKCSLSINNNQKVQDIF